MKKLEQIARAMCAADGVDPDRQVNATIPVRMGHGRGYIEQRRIIGQQPAWMKYEPAARAAVQALLEPCEGMVEAGGDATMRPRMHVGSNRHDAGATACIAYAAMLQHVLDQGK